MPTAIKLIAKNVLSTSAASVTFSGVPSTYTDLRLEISARSAASALTSDVKVRFNGATTDALHTAGWLRGNGNTASTSASSFGLLGLCPGATASANTFASMSVDIPIYSGSRGKRYSSFAASEDAASIAYLYAIAGQWDSTAAITSMTILIDGGHSFAANSSFFLYGITKA